jgi:hypothetical protein
MFLPRGLIHAKPAEKNSTNAPSHTRLASIFPTAFQCPCAELGNQIRAEEIANSVDLCSDQPVLGHGNSGTYPLAKFLYPFYRFRVPTLNYRKSTIILHTPCRRHLQPREVLAQQLQHLTMLTLKSPRSRPRFCTPSTIYSLIEARQFQMCPWLRIRERLEGDQIMFTTRSEIWIGLQTMEHRSTLHSAFNPKYSPIPMDFKAMSNVSYRIPNLRKQKWSLY